MPVVFIVLFYQLLPSLSLNDVCLTCVLHFLSMVLCLLVQCFSESLQSPLKPMYTSRESKSEFFHSSPPFPHQSCLQGEDIQIPQYSLEKWWKDLMGHAGESCREVLSPVPCTTHGMELVGALCCFVCSRRMDTGQALARWWSWGWVCPPPHHVFNVKTVKVGEFWSGMVCHGTADWAWPGLRTGTFCGSL